MGLGPTYKVVDEDNNENHDLKEIFWPMLPHVPVKIGTPILKNLCHSHQNQGKACNHNDYIQDAEKTRLFYQIFYVLKNYVVIIRLFQTLKNCE